MKPMFCAVPHQILRLLATDLTLRLLRCVCMQVTILNTVNVKLPFLPADEELDVKEEVRLRTRVLDLRYLIHTCSCICR